MTYCNKYYKLERIIKMKVDVIVGGLYGDEGKGKIISYLGDENNYDYIFRVNASTNASHSVQLDNSSDVIITKQLPSVFFNDKVKFVVGPGAVLNLHALKEEVFSRPDIDLIKGRVSVASSICLLIKPYIEKSVNKAISENLGSTNQGTGVAVLARTRRHCLHLYDVDNVINGLVTRDYLKEKIKFSCNEIDHNYFKDKSNDYYYQVIDELIDDYHAIENKIGNFSVDYTKFLNDLPPSSKILIEGCNGIMLDNIHGLNPYTTSASTSINSLLNGANLSPYYLDKSYIVCTGYFCCLNKRPFVTEMNANDQKKIYQNNSEVDNAEGMLRRVGWFDLPTLKRALMGHKKSELIINKLDVMKDFDEIKVCTKYVLPSGEKIDIMPDNTNLVEVCKPEYITFKGWGSLDGVKDEKGLPGELKNFIAFVEKETGFKVRYIAVGRKKSDLIKL